MINYKEILRLLTKDYSQREIARSCQCARSTVQRVQSKLKEFGITCDQVADKTNEEIERLIYPNGNNGGIVYELPDYDYWSKELSKPGVTLQLCWVEYCEACQAANRHAYKYTQFVKHYHDHIQNTKATMHLEHKRGETMQVDWCGTTLSIINKQTGKEEKVYVFTAVLPYSGYTYAEAFLNTKQESWISAHVNAYAYFGGVTRILIPDNLKTGVIKNTKDETVLNKVYQEMAEHYGTAIIPARPLSPKDKAAVEGTVGNITNAIIAPMRNKQFFSRAEINEEIFTLLENFNNKPFQKKDGSRASLFEEERPYLLPLPFFSYEMATWKVAKVQYNYHVVADEKYYSCPYEYIGKMVDVRITPRIIEIYYKGTRIASHVRLKESDGLYSTTFEHMPVEHQHYSKWNGDKFRKWAMGIGGNTYEIICYFLESPMVEEQGYKSCMTLLKMAEKYSKEELENACERCRTLTRHPTLRVIRNILETPKPDAATTLSNYGIVRGPEYYKT